MKREDTASDILYDCIADYIANNNPTESERKMLESFGLGLIHELSLVFEQLKGAKLCQCDITPPLIFPE